MFLQFLTIKLKYFYNFIFNHRNQKFFNNNNHKFFNNEIFNSKIRLVKNFIAKKFHCKKISL